MVNTFPEARCRRLPCDGHSDAAGKQANRAAEDVQNQEGELHPSTSFQRLPLRIRLVKEDTRFAMRKIHGL
jgi:hypothetical protein